MSSDPSRRSTVEDGPTAPDEEAMVTALAEFLRAAGLPDAADSETPSRTARAWTEDLLSGYRQDPTRILAATWPDRTSDMVTLDHVPFVSLCAHHLLPFFGNAHLAYLPDGKLTGLSRLEALVECLARRLQVQERLTEEIVEAIMSGVGARGAMCVLDAEHLCVTARGKRRPGVRTRTVASRGEFSADGELQDRFLRMLHPGAPRRHER